MRMVSTAASLLLAVSLAAPAMAASEKQKIQRVKRAGPTWEQCYAMSRQRGFDHELDEWLQSIEDCMAGKIPL